MKKILHFISVAITLMVAVVLFVGVSWPVQAATNKSYTHATDGYQFKYSSTWKTVTGAKSVTVSPSKASLASLKSKDISYSLSTSNLNANTTVFTAALQKSLTAGWTKFVPAYAKVLGKKYGASPTVKTYSKKNWLASELIIKRRVNNVNTTWRFVVLTRDKKKVFVVAEKWTKQTASPFDADVATLLKTLTHYTPPLVTWSFDGTVWKASSPPPDCANPTVLQAPVDLSRAYSVLYPGQYRGGNYKAHGGFRFDGQAYDSLPITAPLDAYVVQGSRHYENGIIQILLDFQTPCGIRYRFDHLHTLSPAMTALIETIPLRGELESFTYPFTTPKFVKAGDLIASAIGGPGNPGFDWGVYDLRTQNTASQGAAFRTEHADAVQMGWYSVCWFDWLSAADEATVRALPAADGINGSNSDYCS